LSGPARRRPRWLRMAAPGPSPTAIDRKLPSLPSMPEAPGRPGPVPAEWPQPGGARPGESQADVECIGGRGWSVTKNNGPAAERELQRNPPQWLGSQCWLFAARNRSQAASALSTSSSASADVFDRLRCCGQRTVVGFGGPADSSSGWGPDAFIAVPQRLLGTAFTCDQTAHDESRMRKLPRPSCAAPTIGASQRWAGWLATHPPR